MSFKSVTLMSSLERQNEEVVFFLMAPYIINQRNSKYSMDLLQEFFENNVLFSGSSSSSNKV